MRPVHLYLQHMDPLGAMKVLARLEVVHEIDSVMVIKLLGVLYQG